MTALDQIKQQRIDSQKVTAINKKDHINDMMSMLKEQKSSTIYKSTFDFDDNHKKELKEHNWEHHFRMDNEKLYVEAMLKHTKHERIKEKQ